MSMQLYNTVAQIWVSDTETIPIPILGVFDSAQAAQDNAYVVVARTLTEMRPELLDRPVTVVAVPLSDDAVREALASIRQHRPDLLPTPRGKAK